MHWLELIFKMVFAVLVGGVIGSERARHGRAAGMRTHVLVCLGAALTSMTSLYVANKLGNNGDVFRISAQVISGVGFLGAGMIILKNNNMIPGSQPPQVYGLPVPSVLRSVTDFTRVRQ